MAGLVPGLERQPLKRQAADEKLLLKLVFRWRDEAIKTGSTIRRIAVAFEAGRDGFWLARWLCAHGIEAYVIHPNSVPVSREHRRAKSDRLDTALLMRAFLGWLRGEAKHCSMVAIPSLAQEDARRPNREHEHLVGERTRIINRMKAAMVRLGVRGFKAVPPYPSAPQSPSPSRLRRAISPPTCVGARKQSLGKQFSPALVGTFALGPSLEHINRFNPGGTSWKHNRPGRPPPFSSHG